MGGLLLSALLQAVVSLHFVLHNNGVITDIDAWYDFIAQYPRQASVFDAIVPPEGFLAGYRVTVDGFPVVWAVLWPLGVVAACAALTALHAGGLGRGRRAGAHHHGGAKGY